MSTARLAVSTFAAATAVFALANLSITRLASPQSNSLESAIATDLHSASITGKPESWWMAKQYMDAPVAPDVVLLGSSQMQCFYTTDAKESGSDIDELLDHHCRTLEGTLRRQLKTKIETFNASIAGSMISDRYLIAKTLLSQRIKPKLVIIGISPRDFVDSTLPSLSSTEPFRFFGPLAHDENFDSAAFTNSFEGASWMLGNSLPFRNVGLSLSQSLNQLFNRQHNSSTSVISDNTPFEANKDSLFCVRPGKCLIPAAAFEGFINNTKEYAGRYAQKNSKTFDQQSLFFDKLLKQLKKDQIASIVVGMPLAQSNSALLAPGFWESFNRQVQETSSRNGSTFIDYSRSPLFTQSDFADGVHLNWRGGAKLSTLLADCIANNKRAALALSNSTQIAGTSTPH